MDIQEYDIPGTDEHVILIAGLPADIELGPVKVYNSGAIVGSDGVAYYQDGKSSAIRLVYKTK